MNKNPFAPQPSYNPQPPLPPGPPPPQPTQPDYSAYWAAAAAAQPHGQPPYNAQWPGAPAAAPPRPPAEQSALYANYGYGGQQNFQWQHQQRVQQAAFQPPQPPPPPPQQYNPYHPQAAAGFVQPYIPQSAPVPPPPPPIMQQPYVPPAPQQQQRPFYPPQQQQQRPMQHQQQQQQHGHTLHHTPPQHLPPAKRIRFDAPGAANGRPPQQHLPPPQPQFQPPPPPPGPMPGQMMPQQPMGPGGYGGGRGGGPGGAQQGRGGGQSGRGAVRGGRGGNMANNSRVVGRGRGGGVFNGGRGGNAQGGNQLKNHGSRGNFGGNRDFGNRRGGSFMGGGGGGPAAGGGHGHHQQGTGSASFRGRGQSHAHPHSYSRGGRHDGSSGGSGMFGSRDGAMTSSSFMSNTTNGSGKKDENRRTLTDFKIVGLEIRELSWTWGQLHSIMTAPKPEPHEERPSTAEDKVDDASPEPTSEVPQTKEEVEEPLIVPPADEPKQEELDDAAVKSDFNHGLDTTVPPAVDDKLNPTTTTTMAAPSLIPPPPSRLHIYFHTPVTPDDSHPIPHIAGSFTFGSSDDVNTRKGKRKKLEDDDGDLEERRAPPPPPGRSHHERSVSVDRVDRASVAPSVAETASEGDWLMAAIGEDEGDADGEVELHVSEIGPHVDGDAVGGESNGDVPEGGDYGNYDDTVVSHGDGGGEIHDMSLTEDPPGLADGQALDDAHDASVAASVAPLESVEDGEPQEPSQTTEEAEASEPLAGDETDIVPHLEQEHAVPPHPSDPAPPNADAASASDVTGPPIADPTDVSTSAPVVPDNSVASSSSVSAPSVPAPSAEPASPEQTADHPPSPDPQVLNVQPSTQEDGTTSSTTVIDRSLTQEVSFGDLQSTYNDEYEATQVETQIDEPISPDATTLVSGDTSISTYGELNQLMPVKNEPQPGARTPSANRLSISYAAGTKRLVINAEIVEKLTVFRSEGRIEILVRLERDGVNELDGILIESLSDSTKSYSPLETLSPVVEADPTVPPFSKAGIPCVLTLLVHLDTERPFSEPKWVKTGDVQEWLKSMFGRMFWVAGDAAEGWEKKIEVVDPDPAPTIWTVLEGWSVNSPVGLLTERQRFLRTHLSETDNLLEILLRLVRGERATPFSQSAPAISAPSISGPLLSALSQGSAHGAQQTHVSLAVLAMFRMAMEYAKKAVGEEKGKSEVEERVGEIIRCLPSHLLYKSLDGIFKEWKVEKRNGR
ncbi:hypothetical protein BV25DRAFT_1910854 [Artomyces pyxidatus]|uniref:Uncharacterized protein n=1 Tax=Artomyces pyxidatus TaxID=48021 RepID=A0ACB8TL76_9AGAM|nr:hypothetical protein BV25DRAFT_1910854 [Artomyces pyxidatus]